MIPQMSEKAQFTNIVKMSDAVSQAIRNQYESKTYIAREVLHIHS